MTTAEVIALSHRDNPIAARGACDTLATLLTAQPKRGEQLAQLIGTLKNHPTLR